jgi:transcriptional regulator with XRE-family HTH domain
MRIPSSKMLPIDSPLRRARVRRRMTLMQLAVATGLDVGGLSRIERGLQIPGKATVEVLVQFFGGSLTEMQILYPERYSRLAAA